jgi:hypothetical protein
MSSVAATTHHVFVDFENVPVIDIGLIAGHLAKVTLLIGKRQQKLDLALVRQIHRLAGQVEMVEVGASGRNALDLTLAHYLGRAVQSEPGTTFAIVSRDKDFDPLVAHLKETGVEVSRHDSFAALPFLSPAKRATPPKPPTTKAQPAGRSAQPSDRLAKLAARLSLEKAPRPRTKARLLALINTDLGGKLTESEKQAMLAELVSLGVLTVDANGKIVYPTK